jgi:parallel beta-helix repeat protein
MKKPQPFFHPNFLFRKTSWVLAIVLTITIVMSGCKKELSPPGSDAALTLESRAASSKDKAPDITVHAGGSIQAAIDAASPGNIIQIEAGTYQEAIVVNKSGIQLIGLTGSANQGVIIENPGDEENGITVQDDGDGFVLKNVTVQNFEENGVFLQHVDNFLLSHVTAINNGEYGLFPVFCNGGVIEHCTSSGHTDTGIYVGQSSNVEMSFNNAHGNVQGLEIENSSNVTAIKNQCYDNAAGILVSLLPGLTVTTSSNIIVSNNHVYNNNHINFSNQDGGFENFTPSGTGILILAGTAVTVKDNNISGNNTFGVAVISGYTLASFTGITAFVTAIDPEPHGYKIVSNVLNNNGSVPSPIPLPAVDLLWDGPLWGGTAANVCYMSNIFDTSFPSPLPSCN